MYEIIDGTQKNKGLRAAKNATILDGDMPNIAFVAGDANIIYFLDEKNLYRGIFDSEIEEIPNINDCEKVLDQVGEFLIIIDDKIVTVKIEIDAPNVKNVELQTKVRIRNAK